MYVQKIKKFNILQTLVLMLSIIFSLIVAFVVFFDFKKPECYKCLFLLPLSFAVCSVLFHRIFTNIPKNLGATLIIILFFIRMVVTPLFMSLGNYSCTVHYGIEDNTIKAIGLVIYELFMVFLTLWLLSQKESSSEGCCIEVERKTVKTKCPFLNNRYLGFILLAIAVLGVCVMIVPEIMTGYRTIFSANDETFTHHEDWYVLWEYGTTLLRQIAIATGQCLIRALMIMVPSFLIIKLANKKTVTRKILAVLCCLMPLLCIGGTIAQSLIFVVCLFLLYNNLFDNNKFSNKPLIIIGIAGMAVLVWWLLRGGVDYSQLSRRFSAYCSGVNVVSGIFNLPRDLKYRLAYFFYDYTCTLPYGTGVFPMPFGTLADFFNQCNDTVGQIPPTIGQGYLYFGAVLAPIYSMLLAKISYSAGEKMNMDFGKNRIKYVRLLLTVFYFSMGIVMYNFEITMTTFFSLMFPMYILEKIVYKKEEK